MDAELKAKWVQALRSGDYAQTKMQLRDGRGGFCCLGVLCQVAGLEISSGNSEVVIDGKDSGYRPLEAILGAEVGGLYRKNDDGMPFAEIADYIEQNL